MLVELAKWLTQFESGFNVFSYLTMRMILVVLTALGISFIFGPRLIRKLTKYKSQPIRDDGPESHLEKIGTPTMGGLLILISISVSTLLWGDLGNRYIWVLLLTTLGFGAIGFVDDYIKLVKQDPNGMASRQKYLLQSLIGVLVAAYLYYSATTPQQTQLFFPFFKDWVLNLGFFYIVIAYFYIVGFSNAVNLTDGLDGLAIMPTILVAGALAVLAYVTGHIEFAKYLHIPYLRGAGEVAIFCAAITGAGIGFLWFNTYPAMVFMGDIGALALGAALGAIAIIIRQEFVLIIMGGIFVIETLSVMIQILSFRMTGRRIFRMAPIHHHYELKGWPEPRVIVRFWIISLILVLVGLATIKLR